MELAEHCLAQDSTPSTTDADVETQTQNPIILEGEAGGASSSSSVTK